MKPIFAILLLATTLAGCGSRGLLNPKPGVALPLKPAEARSRPTAAQLLLPTPSERPNRSEEVLTKSAPRPDDRFDLPPAG